MSHTIHKRDIFYFTENTNGQRYKYKLIKDVRVKTISRW